MRDSYCTARLERACQHLLMKVAPEVSLKAMLARLNLPWSPSLRAISQASAPRSASDAPPWPPSHAPSLVRERSSSVSLSLGVELCGLDGTDGWVLALAAKRVCTALALIGLPARLRPVKWSDATSVSARATNSSSLTWRWRGGEGEGSTCV